MRRKWLLREGITEFLRFVVVGVIATVIHYLLYLSLLYILSEIIAYSIGYACSLILNFYLTSTFTFKENSSVRKMVGFGLSHLINYTLHIYLLLFFLSLEVDEFLAPIPVFAIAVLVNYLLVRFVFKSKYF